ncbi:hypothetical protein BGLA2_490050 [Burkholderia gladioli]|nr:hypothetical protein BGLA2_490050 [Burkholderia gladioli]
MPPRLARAHRENRAWPARARSSTGPTCRIRRTRHTPHPCHPSNSDHHDRTDPTAAGRARDRRQPAHRRAPREAARAARARRRLPERLPADPPRGRPAGGLRRGRQGRARGQAARGQAGRPDDAAPRDGQGQLRDGPGRFGPDPVLRYARRCRRRDLRRVQEVGPGRHRRRERRAVSHQQGRAVGQVHRAAPAGQGAAPAAGQVPRPGRPGDALPAALRRPDRHARDAQHLPRPHQGDRLDPQVHGGCGLHGSRDADAAPDPRRRDGQALRHAPQRARHGDVPAHRARALPEAAGGGRLRARVRDQPEFPQRGRLAAPQPGIHDDGVLRGLYRLPLDDGFHRAGDPPGGGRFARHRDDPVPGPRARPRQALPSPHHQAGDPEVRARLQRRATGRRGLSAHRAQALRRRRRPTGLPERRPRRAAARAVRGNRRGAALGADLHHRLPGRGLAAGARIGCDARRHRALRAVHDGPRDRQRLLRAQRSGRPGRALQEAGRPEGCRRRGSDVLRRRLHPRTRIRHAPDRRLRHRHRPPGDAADRQPDDPRRAAVPAPAPRGLSRILTQRAACWRRPCPARRRIVRRAFPPSLSRVIQSTAL